MAWEGSSPDEAGDGPNHDHQPHHDHHHAAPHFGRRWFIGGARWGRYAITAFAGPFRVDQCGNVPYRQRPPQRQQQKRNDLRPTQHLPSLAPLGCWSISISLGRARVTLLRRLIVIRGRAMDRVRGQGIRTHRSCSSRHFRSPKPHRARGSNWSTNTGGRVGCP